MIVARWGEHAKHKSAIIAAIEDQRRADPHANLGVGTGWSGPKTLFGDPRCAALVAWVLAQLPVGGWQVHGWGNVMRAGDFIAPHDHRASHLGGENEFAGAYYPDDGPPSASLCVQQEDGWMRRIPPEAGSMVIFSARASHYVRKVEGSRRVSVAFNVAPSRGVA